MALESISPSFSERVEQITVWLSLMTIFLSQAFPAQALAFADTLSRSGYFPQHVIFERSIPASYPFKEGTILAVLISGYSSTRDQTDGDPLTTASGTTVRDGVLASNFLPLGTVVRIGERELMVEDRLNSRYNDTYRADIWFSSRQKAIDFGIQRGLVEILKLP